MIFFITSEIYVFVSLGFGLLVSIISSSQIVAVVITLLVTIIPSFLYSGMIMPISSMSGDAYIMAHIYPVMYYNHLIYDTFLVGQGFTSPTNLLYIFILIGYAILLFTIAFFSLKKEIK